MPQPQFLYLTTVGRASRRPREIEIWFTERAGRHYVIAEYQTSHWVQNLRANPQVRWRVGNDQFAGLSRVVVEEPLRSTIQQQSREKFGWGDGMVVELEPNGQS